MRRYRFFITAALFTLALSRPVLADEGPTKIFDQKTGDTTLAEFTVDTAPGTVSAMALLGVSGDQLAVIENPRDLTVLLKSLDGGNAMGFSITPARTSLLPLNVSTYNKHLWARAWAGTTFSYAQATPSVNDKNYHQRAVSIETSFFLDADRDDPLVVYWNKLKAAGPKLDDKDPCLLIPTQRPEGPAAPAAPAVPGAASAPAGPVVPALAPAELAAEFDKRAGLCRDQVVKSVRWNASRVWASWATGSYKGTTSGSNSHGLGRTVVLGGTWGIGDATTPVASAITVAVKHVAGEPVLSTFDADVPTRKSTNLSTLRGALGSTKLRALLEASNYRDGDPSASERVYKRAVGIDFRLAKGMWLNFRAGKQRRIDNKGDETGSSLSLSYSPSALLEL
jgi:hypothetical protein